MPNIAPAFNTSKKNEYKLASPVEQDAKLGQIWTKQKGSQLKAVGHADLRSASSKTIDWGAAGDSKNDHNLKVTVKLQETSSTLTLTTGSKQQQFQLPAVSDVNGTAQNGEIELEFKLAQGSTLDNPTWVLKDSRKHPDQQKAERLNNAAENEDFKQAFSKLNGGDGELDSAAGHGIKDKSVLTGKLTQAPQPAAANKKPQPVAGNPGGAVKFQEINGLKRPLLADDTDDAQFSEAQKAFRSAVLEKQRNADEKDLVSFDIPVEKNLNRRVKECRFAGGRIPRRDMAQRGVGQKLGLNEYQDKLAARIQENNIALSLLPRKKQCALQRDSVAAQPLSAVKQHEGYYEDNYEHSKTDQYNFHAHVDFANRFLGGGWRLEHGWAQEEAAFLECRGLRDAAVFCEDAGINLSDADEHKPNPVLIENTRHIAKLQKATGQTSRTAPRELSEFAKPRDVNWLAMAAPNLGKKEQRRRVNGGKGATSKEEALSVLFEQSFAAFSLAKAKADKDGKKCIIHTGKFGCGAFNNSYKNAFTAQLLAARLAGVDSIEFYDIKGNAKDSLERAERRVADICSKSTGTKAMSEWFSDLCEAVTGGKPSQNYFKSY